MEEYRGYKITSGPYAFEFVHRDYDGPPDRRCGHAPTSEDAKEMIDEIEDN